MQCADDHGASGCDRRRRGPAGPLRDTSQHRQFHEPIAEFGEQDMGFGEMPDRDRPPPSAYFFAAIVMLVTGFFFAAKAS